MNYNFKEIDRKLAPIPLSETNFTYHLIYCKTKKI